MISQPIFSWRASVILFSPEEQSTTIGLICGCCIDVDQTKAEPMLENWTE
jgi:hypothetical protein